METSLEKPSSLLNFPRKQKYLQPFYYKLIGGIDSMTLVTLLL